MDNKKLYYAMDIYYLNIYRIHRDESYGHV
jgi:hypothetical protein